MTERPIREPVLVTGGRGFLGETAVRELHTQGHDGVHAPSRSDCDLTDTRATEDLFEYLKPRVVIHAAGEVGEIAANRSNRGRFFYANAMMGLNVIEASRQTGVEKFIYIGTVSSYPEQTQPPFRETDLWSGYPEESNASYGVAKRAMATMLDAYRHQYGFDSTYLLLTNLYGPGDRFDEHGGHVVPSLIRRFTTAAVTGQPKVTIWGDGTATRDLLYVEDAAEAVVAACRAEAPGPINLGWGPRRPSESLRRSSQD